VIEMIRSKLKSKIRSFRRKKQLAEHLVFIYSLALIIVLTAMLQARAANNK
tara:strand:+ start:400 stop:552 length:153 start_codon:yes stop_codon:yes gene_type:complete